MDNNSIHNQASLQHLSHSDWLPYKLPSSTAEQAAFLSKVLNVPTYCKASTAKDVELMMMTLLYPHLSPTDRKVVFPRYASHPNERLAQFLRTEAVMYTQVQPDWGIWAKPTAELENRIQANKRINKALELVGASSFYDLAQKGVKQGKIRPYVLLLSLVYGGSKVALKEAENEREYRLSGGKVGDFAF